MNRYKALLKVVEVGSYTKAAKMLGYTQPALSQMISSLEKETSIKFLYRSRYGIKLTSEGKHLLPKIQQTLQQYEQLKEMENEINGLNEGIVRIGTISSISCHWLPLIIKDFWKDYPNIQLVLHQGDYKSICEWVQNDIVDFGFVNPAAVKGLETRILKSDSFVAVLPKNHPLAKKEIISLKELEKESYLLLEEGNYSEPLEAFQKEHLTPNIRLRMHDDYSILSMVEQGLGYSILSKLILRKTAYNIKVLPIKEPIIRTLSLVTKDKRSLSLAAKTFMNYILDNLEYEKEDV